MGLYWTLTSTLFNMHTGDAFGALGIKDYKNFLRIKLEPGRATIYPIALDRVPGRKGWRWQLAQRRAAPVAQPADPAGQPAEASTDREGADRHRGAQGPLMTVTSRQSAPATWSGSRPA